MESDSMDVPDILIKIIEDRKCPLYALGDEFRLSGAAMELPADKPICLRLVKDITRLCEEEARDRPKDVFVCSGCAGRIRLGYKKNPSAGEVPPKKTGTELTVIAGLLKRFDIFREFDDRDIRDIITYLNLKKFAPGETVIRKGEHGRNLYIVASGRVEILVEEEEVNIAFLGSGEVFGEMSLLSGEPAGATVRVIEPARILYIRNRDFRPVLNRFPSLQMYFARLMAKRLAYTNTARSEEFASGMIGKLTDMSASEIFQTLNTNQKSGVLTLDLVGGTGAVAFREGELVSARFNHTEGVEAFYALLRHKQGRFKFKPGLSEKNLKAEPLGDFMFLLMEGVRLADENA
ncbi:MAG: cyclic nucleotide-binding domain-containing protein [Thermodesulfobacteriota bacterium]